MLTKFRILSHVKSGVFSLDFMHVQRRCRYCGGAFGYKIPIICDGAGAMVGHLSCVIQRSTC